MDVSLTSLIISVLALTLASTVVALPLPEFLPWALVDTLMPGSGIPQAVEKLGTGFQMCIIQLRGPVSTTRMLRTSLGLFSKANDY
ncbi:uncharacterized protein BO97DRAFT_420801 [Aspergillus homomorphus CBS 101889]|uniref:Uncharacterized protein n=1 Tax=Aspergillus homomorphus (strain CBS 101889) TaxID=1450537 RepID=A0A395I8B8_ASPHC|nr:hypothetical protein BO97DRAFT_420801 [Aspergillus homomorphus CBS 101889]RAL16500.1 hypothetical protein BO97DRAFT_420801 [Aspergillus homomorphus CBS 101889]